MDIADDIAYSCYDLEDALKAGFVSLFDSLTADHKLLSVVAEKTTAQMKKLNYDTVDATTNVGDVKRIIYEAFVSLFKPYFAIAKAPTLDDPESLLPIVTHAHRAANDLAADDYKRSSFISDLIAECIMGVEVIPNESHPPLTEVRLQKDVRKKVEVFKHLIYTLVTSTPRLRMVEYRGREIVRTIFNLIWDGQGGASRSARPEFVPDEYRQIWEAKEADPLHQKRTVADFISAMSDHYALEYYGRLTAEKPQTIFKPL